MGAAAEGAVARRANVGWLHMLSQPVFMECDWDCCSVKANQSYGLKLAMAVQTTI
jgi:hypothetical protein